MGNPQTKITIGRDPGCDVALADDTVSSRHAEISFLPGGKLLLTDCKSRNGTFRQLPDGQEQRVRQELISPLDRLRFGDVRLRARDILEAVHLKRPAADPGRPRPPGPPLAEGRHLERCDCGAVKASGGRCPECGR